MIAAVMSKAMENSRRANLRNFTPEERESHADFFRSEARLLINASMSSPSRDDAIRFLEKQMHLLKQHLEILKNEGETAE
jgi:hypothetical protein